MLDKETKRIIDNARDVLVGKVPNPLSQIDLITTAMIYKFMDDMDLSNISFGGERIFFTGDFEKYAWSKLLSSTVGNYDRLNLYAEALDKLPYAKQIPPLFRNIFKDAFLPFRDGSTLTMFLKEINCLSYDNSENLGDAFEYLLSIMSSQGDAGQFRTPRHIIDFIVEVVNPTKTDTILDPACGTSGFLISAYKHILNTAKSDKKTLTVDEIKTITTNIEGYDIDPTMVKLSLVNLYLHKFTNPKIYEYDSLSSDDRWGDKFDVILANPPFMTPKGGIRPHNKFGIKANRSEVLFVDYFMEHLTLNGRAGFVVPEGIIFQSATAYKSLRKMMVEDKYLYAVVSLPAGVFNPYSGVKTSILFFDRELAKKTDKILFVDIKNDGFDLGAQRRPIKENDLPSALQFIQEYQKSYNQDLTLPSNCLLVEKSKIAENGEYNLTASRYKQSQDLANSKWEMVKLGDILDYEQPTKYIVTSENYDDSYKIPVLTAGQTFLLGYTNEDSGIYNNLPVIIFDDFTTANKWVDFPFKVKSSAMKMLIPKDRTAVNLRFVYYMIQNILYDSSIHKRYWISEYSNIEIPLPPLEVQEEIVKELEGYQAIIDGAQKVVDNWKPSYKLRENWEQKKIGELFEISYGVSISIPENEDSEGIKIISTAETTLDGYLDLTKIRKVKMLEKYNSHILEPNMLLFNWRNAPKHIGKTVIFDKKDEKYICASFLLPMKVKDASKILLEWGWLEINRLRRNGYFIEHSRQAVNQTNFNASLLAETEIYLPTIEEQRNIIEGIKEEEQYVDACKKLIELNKQKISDKIKSIWNSDKEE